MTQPISLLLINSATRTATTALLAQCRPHLDICASVDSLTAGMTHLKAGRPPHVVLLEVQSIAQGVRDISAILAACPQTMIMVTASEKQPDWILTLIRAGACEYLTTPLDRAELEGALERAARIIEQKQGGVVAGGKVISVYNPSGGVGTTTIAVNLAAVLTARGDKAALIDLNPFSSDVASLLDLTSVYTLSNIAASGSQVDASFLMSILTQHSSGIQVLCGPEEVGTTAEMAPDRIRTLLSLMQSLFSFTLIDVAGTLTDQTHETFESSDMILFPLTLTLPALNNARRYLAALDFRGFGSDRVKVIVNRYLPKDDIKVADAEKILKVKVFHSIPNSFAETDESIYKGIPLVIGYPRSPITKALNELTDMVVTELTGVPTLATAPGQSKKEDPVATEKSLFQFSLKRVVNSFS